MQVYYEECGNPNGKPVVIVHGGPGGGCSPQYRTFHDPEAYRIILFDQRGAKNERLLSWSHYYTRHDCFTKTGSGQT
jgi:pimeloyl-ACP methyl ester carboxylesterase